MGFYLHRYSKIFDIIYPKRTWRKSTDNTIYLTFDDGPINEITPWILDVLKKEEIKATFFCVGENLRRFPDLKNRLIQEGHVIGNHTNSHENASKVGSDTFLESVLQCENEIGLASKKLFRPPHGRLSKSLEKVLGKKYKIVMWSTLSGDFDSNLDKESCLIKTQKATKSGSIIVFHDNIRCVEKIKWVLPRYLISMKAKGYKFGLL